MDRTQLAFIADIISLVSGFMTIIGIGGIVSWSIFRGRSSQLSDAVLNVFAYSMKIGLCLLLGIVLVLAAAGLIMLLQYGLLEPALTSLPSYNFYTYDETVRNPAQSIAVLTTILVLAPSYLLSCASIFFGSAEPWRRFFSALRHRKPTDG